MCGLFGAIGTEYSIDKVRSLALINEKRGDDALGFFDATGKSLKYADKPYKCLGRKNFTGFIRNAQRRSWFLAGHTRAASYMHGGNLTAHAHPFRYGKTIGAHNGYTPREWKDKDKWPVDSQIIFEALEAHKSDYQKALEDLDGYWGLSWLDGYTNRFYLSTRDNEIALVKVGNVYYYSSDIDHLTAALGAIESYWDMKDGSTAAFWLEDGQVQIEWCPKFEAKTKDWKTTKADRAKGSVGSYGHMGYQQGGYQQGGYRSNGSYHNTSDDKKGSNGATAPCGFRVPTIYGGQTDETYQKELWEREACCVCQDRVAEAEQLKDTETDDIYCRECAKEFNIAAWNDTYERDNDPNDPFHFDEAYVSSKDSTCKDEGEWQSEWEDSNF